MDPKKKFFLFKFSKNFCSVPWNYFKIDVDGEVRTCVKGTQRLGNINQQSINEILSNSALRQIREELYQDKLPTNCEKCREMDNSHETRYSFLRDMYNDWFQSVPVDYADPTAFHLSGLDLHWASTCNLKCVTCGPRQSSAIAAEMRMPIMQASKDKIDSAIDYCIQHQKGLKELYFSGGEPTLIKHNITLLENLEPRPDLLLRVNTNMTFDRNNRFMQRLKQFPRVLITMSADATHERFDYIRHGASWSQFVDNLKFCQEQAWQLRINSVFFVASAWTLIETQDFFRSEFAITDFTINQCEMNQYQLLCRNLPPAVKRKVREDILKSKSIYRDKNLNGQLENCLKELAQDPNDQDYRQYFDDLDGRRAGNWRALFPELS